MGSSNEELSLALAMVGALEKRVAEVTREKERSEESWNWMVTIRTRGARVEVPLGDALVSVYNTARGAGPKYAHAGCCWADDGGVEVLMNRTRPGQAPMGEAIARLRHLAKKVGKGQPAPSYVESAREMAEILLATLPAE